MMTQDGRLFIIDIIQEKLKDKVTLQDQGANSVATNIAEAQMENAYNTLIFRTFDNKFYWLQNVVSGIPPMAQPSPFDVIRRFQDLGNDLKMEFTFVPKQESKSKQIELFITDPTEGFHLLKDKKDSHVYYQYQSQVDDDDDDPDVSSPFGQVKYIALSAKKDMLAMYADAELSGRIFVMKTNMTRVLDDKETQ